MTENIELVIFSFLCSLGLGIVFRMNRKCLLFAGIGGAITRIVYILMIEATEHIFLQTLCAAIVAALFAEIMAMNKKVPSTVFLYPSIIPLIPGTSLYNICVNIILGNQSEALSYAWECFLALSGMCLGFVLISTFTYYRKIYKMGAALERKIEIHIKCAGRRLKCKRMQEKAGKEGEEPKN